jgi:hypothetical protein
VHAGARIPGGPVVVEILQRVVEGRVVFGSDDDVARCVRVHVGPGAIPRSATGRPACSRPPSAATSPERSARRPSWGALAVAAGTTACLRLRRGVAQLSS